MSLEKVNLGKGNLDTSSKAKPNKRKEQAAETKKRIYEAAKKLFLEHNIEEVSVDSIVHNAGVSKGSFYVHYDSKDALVSILINDYVNEIDLDYKTYLESMSPEMSITEILIAMAEKISDVIANKVGYDNMKNLYKAHITKTINSEYAMSYDRDLYKMFHELLARGVDQGELRSDISSGMLANQLVLAIRGITFEWCIRYPNFDLKEQCVMQMSILLRGIRK